MKQIICLILVFIIWLGLTWSLDPQMLFAGMLFAALTTLFLSGIYPEVIIQLLHIRRWFWLIAYIPYFAYYCIKANLDVAYRVLNPNMPIRPGIVKVKTELISDLGRAMLANSITLTPGTLTVDVDEQDFYVHWINITSDDPEEETRIIVKRFEKFIRRIFE